MPRTLAAAAVLTLAAAPALADEVNVYTTRQPELIEPIFEAFTEKTGIEVNALFAEKGLIERMKAEGARSPADLYITADIANVKAATDAGLTQPHGSAAIEEHVPEALRGDDGHWFALTTRSRVAYASKDRVDPSEITTWEALADDEWNDRICVRPGSHSYNLSLIAAMIAHHGEDDTRQWLTDLKDNLARKPQGNDRAQIKAVWAGECDVAIANTYYYGKMLEDEDQREWADSVQIVFPTFEEGGAHMNISGAAIPQNAPNRDDALKLVEYMLSPEAQQMYAEANYEYPVRTDVERSDLVEGWGDFEADALPLSEIADKRDEALRLVEEVGFDG
ncbi:MAG TPA: Fe(3+) ABC transporter substrate-binding protein [Thermohalobaculum sp.]|nr:Fe(3+) ABC transporter substrate-binding protein [Thermohalobaculum sp.]